MAEEHLSRARFIRLSAALGVGTAGASMLAACGGESGGGAAAPAPSEEPTTAPNEGAPEETTAQETSGTEADQGGAIAQEADVAPGSALPFQNAGQPAVLVHLESGDFVAYSAVCTHAGCEVAYNNSQLACPCHGSVFDPANGGAVVSPPANRPLPEIPVEVRDGQVFTA
ncbi:MAG: Ubiquinol-cytochrome C reductase iron-sulfur subunit [uncultured Rubrobacteraceae bacterium]|uniref:Cytochrome bc1 complex Rieske iron-sulfur subunit n=1 Tax=uncultured Rubrobacteraceae bacterium TaxID=349277 RepID=A0A6J4RPW7_9ACTN|nr:MAG: Ubiquinol-cytochrome C reductase iron-sulfur subunit [uncultured Rubrobacteraceae bacterium]